MGVVVESPVPPVELIVIGEEPRTVNDEQVVLPVQEAVLVAICPSLAGNPAVVVQ